MTKPADRKSKIFAAAAVMAFVAILAAAGAEQRRVGPAFRPALRLEHMRPAAHFEICTNVYWYPHVVQPRWQAGPEAKLIDWMKVERQAGGLVMKLREHLLPRAKPPAGVWFTLFRPVHGQAHPNAWHIEPSPVCFGTVRPLPMLPGEHSLAEERPCWGSNKLTYRYLQPLLDGGEEESVFSITISRLTPGVLVECESDMALFFSELPKPVRHMAWPEAGKMRYHTVPEGEVLAAAERSWQEAAPKTMVSGADEYEEVECGAPAWMLVWFGENGSYFHASRDGRWLYSFHNMASSGEGHPIGIESVLETRGSTARADMPFLLVFESGPLSFCMVEGGGIRFTFADRAGRIVLHPLFGEDPPATGEDKAWQEHKGWRSGLAYETRAWPGKLPEEIIAKCEWWNKRLREFPTDAEERASYDAAVDELKLSCRFQFEQVGEGGVKFAPLPPMLALAMKTGFPARTAEPPADSGYYTQLGPYLGVDGAVEYEVIMSGLAKYVKQFRTPGSSVCPQQARLEQRLQEELKKMFAAGRLAPALYHAYIDVWFQMWMGGFPFVWTKPGETLSCLSAAMDFLPEEMRRGCLEYMREEQRARPAEQTLMAPVRDGARREPFRLDTRMPRWHERLRSMADYRGDIIEMAEYLAQENDRYLKEQLLPPEALYALAEYCRRDPQASVDWQAARRLMDAWDARRDWASLGFVRRDPSRVHASGWWFFTQTGGRDAWAVEIANAYFAGCIGLARLAPRFEQPDGITEAYLRFYLAAAHRYALENYVPWLYDAGLLRLPEGFEPDAIAKSFSGAWSAWAKFVMDFRPEHDQRRVMVMDELGVSMSPRGDAKAINDWSSALAGPAVPELGRFLNDFMGEQMRKRAAAAYEPADWFVWNSGGYSRKKRLDNADYLFHAWILGAGPAKLTTWLGARWAAAGDLYYIQRLVEALYACRGAEWK